MRLSLSDFLQPLYSRISLLAYPHMVNIVVYLVICSLSFIHSFFVFFLNILCLCLLFVFSFCSSVEPLLFTSFSYLFAFLLYNYLLNILYISPFSFTLYISFSLSTSLYFSMSLSFALSRLLSIYLSLSLFSLSLCVSSSLYLPSPPLSLFQHLLLPISLTLSLPPSFPLPIWYFSIFTSFSLSLSFSPSLSLSFSPSLSLSLLSLFAFFS